MKKTLLCFILLLPALFYAQVTNIEHCAGEYSFDLTTKKTELIGDLNAAETTISYHLSLSDAQSNTNVIANPATYISSESSKTIYARIDNKGSITTNYFNLIVNKSFTSTLIINQINCINSKGSIVAKGIGGKSPYQYSINARPFTSSDTFDDLLPGSYTIMTKDDLGCISSQVAVISTLSPLIADISKKDVNCFGDYSGSITVNASGGILPYSYILKDAYGYILRNPQSKNTFNYLSAGTYTIEVQDSGACILLSAPIYITQPTPLIGSVTIKNQALTFDVTGGVAEYLYAISPNLNQFSQNNVFTGLIPGPYEAIVVDKNGCALQFSISIDPPAPLVNGKNSITVEFKQGQTLNDLILEGQNIKWYATSGVSSLKTGKTAETSLPLSTVLVDGTTYYASQTINSVESRERLAVTAKLNGSLSNPDFDATNFKFYPNPVKHILTIQNNPIIDDIQIFSISGQAVLSKKINNTNAEIDLSSLSSGFYILNVKADGKEKVMKFIKE